MAQSLFSSLAPLLSNFHVVFTLCTAVDSHDVWSFLEDCDIFSAAKIIAQSKILLEACNASTSSSSGGDSRKASPYRFCQFLSPASIQEAATRCKLISSTSSPHLLAGCSSAVFLSQVSVTSFSPLLCSDSDSATKHVVPTQCHATLP